MKNFHVAIVGGGVIGSAIAWELSKYKLDVVIFEKEIDVCSGTSKANSGVIHSGINSAPNSLKAHFCVEGNRLFQSLSDQLGFSLKWTGKYVIAKNEAEIEKLEELKKTGIKNNVPELKIHDVSKIRKKEPNIDCVAGLWVPTAGIVLPYELTIALAENAAINGAKFLLENEVTDINKKNNGFEITTNKGVFKTDIVVNSAGLNCRDIVSMVEDPDFQVYPCRGEYLVLDKKYNGLINSMIYPIPVEEFGILGIHITPTIEGNILIGPSAEFIDNPKDNRTTRNTMKNLMDEAKNILPVLPDGAIINAYSGVRCKLSSPEKSEISDYRIGESKLNPGFFNLLGIESPGLTAAPAIAKEICNMISNHLELKTKDYFKIKKKSKHFNELSIEEKENLIKKDGRWGRVVCRCEHITEAEVVEALSNPLEASALSSVKYRCRAGMGRCQGGFCTQHIVRIMQDDFDMHIADIKLRSTGSNMFFGRNRGTKDD
ncbi:MAG: NAD(P)/FAD-dependent oxidoreductase [Thermoplasmatales archaeon]|nr:MAG: NAD(P)/FAD-dependent oxidoreductase [Thermoplasmatales archaeon]